MELHEKAFAALTWFEYGERKSEDTGRMIRTYPHGDDGPGRWLSDLVHAAHGDMFPDDWRYEMIEAALRYFADEDNDPDDYHQACDNDVPVYNAERLRWLGSHLERAGYCDEAAEELGDGKGDTFTRIGWGYYAEVSEVFGLVRQALDDLDEDDVTTRPEKAAKA